MFDVYFVGLSTPFDVGIHIIVASLMCGYEYHYWLHNIPVQGYTTEGTHHHLSLPPSTPSLLGCYSVVELGILFALKVKKLKSLAGEMRVTLSGRSITQSHIIESLPVVECKPLGVCCVCKSGAHFIFS